MKSSEARIWARKSSGNLGPESLRNLIRCIGLRCKLEIFHTYHVSLRSSARVLAIVRRNFWFPNDRNPIERDSRARFRWEEEGKIVRIKVWNTRNMIKRVESTYIYIYIHHFNIIFISNVSIVNNFIQRSRVIDVTIF